MPNPIPELVAELNRVMALPRQALRKCPTCGIVFDLYDDTYHVIITPRGAFCSPGCEDALR